MASFDKLDPTPSEPDTLREAPPFFPDLPTQTNGPFTELQRALEQSDARYNSLVQLSPDAIFVHSDGVIVFANKQAVRLLGHSSPKELLGRSALDYLHPDCQPRALERIKNLHTGTSSNPAEEFQILRSDGKIVEVESVSSFTPFDGKAAIQIIMRDITQRKRVEQALRESEFRYRSLFNSMSEGSAVCEVIFNKEGEPCDLRIVDINLTAEHRAGISRDRIIGKSFQEILPQTSPDLISSLGRIALDCQPLHFECYSKKYNRHYEIFASSPSSGQVAIIAVDITARKHAEEAIRVNQERLQLSIQFLHIINANVSTKKLLQEVVSFFRDHSGCEAVAVRMPTDDDYPFVHSTGFSAEFLATESSIWLRDSKGDANLLDCKPGLACLCGRVIARKLGLLPAATINGSFFTNDFPETLLKAGPEFCRRLRNRCIAEGYQSLGLIPLRVGSKTLGLLHLADKRKARFTPESIALWEQFAAHLSAALARLKLEASMAENEMRFRRLAESNIVGVITIDERTIIDANDAFLSMTGYTRKDLLQGKLQWSAMTPPEYAESDRKALRALLAGHSVMPFEKEYFRKNGSRVPILVGGSPLPSPTFSSICFVQDLTESKQTQKVLQQARTDLLKQRDDALTGLQKKTTELRTLVSELDKAGERERQRLAHVLHDDLQQTLVAARCKLQTLKVHTKPIPQRRLIEQVDRLITESLSVSRSLTTELSPRMLHELGLGSALQWLGQEYRKKYRITVSVKASDVHLLPQETSLLLFQAARELLFNVVKHSGVHRATVRLEEQTSGTIYLKVSDRGIGFDPTKLSKSGSPEGGFGIFALRERLELFNGSLKIESAPTRGTSVVITLPRKTP